MNSRSLLSEYTLAAFFVVAILVSSVLAIAPREASAATISATLTSTSTNASTTLAKLNDTINFILTLTGGTPTSTPTIDINGVASSTMTNAGSGKYTFSTTTHSNYAGYVIWYGSDTTNNSSSSKSAVTSGVDVRFDNTAPSITAASISSANSSSSTVAKSGDVLTLTATTSEQLVAASSTITLGGNSVQLICTPGSGWNQPAVCTATTTASATTGAITFSLTPVDLAGNVGTAYTTVAGSGVYVYGAAPAITVTGSNPLALYANNGTGYSDAGATATDAAGNSIGVSTVSNNVNPANAGTYTVGYSATDAAGNTSTASRTVTVTAPGGGGPVAGSFGGNGGSLIPVLPGTAPITQTSAPGVNPSGATSTVSSGTVGVNQLMQQLAALQAQLAALTGGTTTFSRNLTVGSTGSDVKALQQYLNAKGYEVASSGPGSAGMETSRFGPATKAALAKFQAAVGISPASGYFGAKTRAYVNANQ